MDEGGVSGPSGASGAGDVGGVSGASNDRGVSASDMGDVSAAASSVGEKDVSAQADKVAGVDAAPADGFERAETAAGPGRGVSEGTQAEIDRRAAENTGPAAEAADAATRGISVDTPAGPGRGVSEGTQAEIDRRAAETAAAAGPGRPPSEGTMAEIGRREENQRVESIADRLAADSPTAARMIADFRARGGVFERSERGGWFNNSNPDRPVIGVPKGTSAENMLTIAHELGHYDFRGNPQGAYQTPGRPEGLTDRQIEHRRQADYITNNVNARLADEGNAALTNKTIRDEVLARTGVDLGISGDILGKPMPFGVGTPDQQRRAIGDYFGTNLRTSTTGENYRSYYGTTYRDHYERNHLPGQER